MPEVVPFMVRWSTVKLDTPFLVMLPIEQPWSLTVGAPFDDAGGFNAGAAYIFEKQGGNWKQTLKLIRHVRNAALGHSDRAYVLEHLNELVVKAVDEAGGYGMLMGPQSTAEQRDEFRQRIIAEPRKYIAQHRIELSACPTWIAEKGCVEPRRIDMRPYILTSREGPWVLPGGLTRVALKAGSYVVNSSQGGGSKDTWVMKDTGS